jgi:hypothetical protein
VNAAPLSDSTFTKGTRELEHLLNALEIRFKGFGETSRSSGLSQSSPSIGNSGALGGAIALVPFSGASVGIILHRLSSSAVCRALF